MSFESPGKSVLLHRDRCSTLRCNPLQWYDGRMPSVTPVMLEKRVQLGQDCVGCTARHLLLPPWRGHGVARRCRASLCNPREDTGSLLGILVPAEAGPYLKLEQTEHLWSSRGLGLRSYVVLVSKTSSLYRASGRARPVNVVKCRGMDVSRLEQNSAEN